MATWTPARAVLDAMPERAFQAQVVAYARLNGWRCWYVHDSRRSPAGWPDVVAIRGGRMVVAELKSEKGRLTVDQQDALCLLRQVPGIEVFVWRPSDFDEIERVLQRVVVVAQEATG